jgi:hypothetical protein
MWNEHYVLVFILCVDHLVIKLIINLNYLLFSFGQQFQHKYGINAHTKSLRVNLIKEKIKLTVSGSFQTNVIFNLRQV